MAPLLKCLGGASEWLQLEIFSLPLLWMQLLCAFNLSILPLLKTVLCHHLRSSLCRGWLKIYTLFLLSFWEKNQRPFFIFITARKVHNFGICSGSAWQHAVYIIAGSATTVNAISCASCRYKDTDLTHLCRNCTHQSMHNKLFNYNRRKLQVDHNPSLFLQVAINKTG